MLMRGVQEVQTTVGRAEGILGVSRPSHHLIATWSSVGSRFDLGMWRELLISRMSHGGWGAETDSSLALLAVEDSWKRP